MNFKIDTGEQKQAPATPREYDGNITFRGFGERADRKARQIIAAIECCETAQEVEDTLIEQDLIIDALMLDYPDLYEGIRTAADDHTAVIANGKDYKEENVLGIVF